MVTRAKRTKQVDTKSGLAASRMAKKKSAKVKIFKEKQTRSEILQHLADNLGMAKSQVEKVFVEFKKVIDGTMDKRGAGELTIPFCGIKIKRDKKKATKPRKMESPLTGQVVEIPAKPARFVVKVKALKVLKDAVDRKDKK